MAQNDLSRGTVVFIAWILLLMGIIGLVSGSIFNGPYSTTSHPLLSRIVVLTTGLLLTSFGLSLLHGWKILPAMGKTLVGILVVSLIVESVSIAGLYIYKRVVGGTESVREANLRLHSGIYRPFVVWRSSPTSSDQVNVTSAGLRVVPGAEHMDNSYKVFVFGGSTMFGWNTPDSLTICANLQQLFSVSMDQPVCVTNFGQQGYVNTQEMIELQLQLKGGNIPDLVIFYDGTNEIWSTISSDTVGVHFNLQEISQLYENRHFQSENTRQLGILSFLSGLNSVVLCRTLLGVEGGSGVTLFQEEPSRCMVEGENFVRSEILAESIMDSYETNLRIIDALSREFEFDYLCFWQPVLITGDKPLTSGELSIAEQLDPFLVSVYKHCEERAKELELEYAYFFSITHAFDETSEDVYTDICHVTDYGDFLISQLIFNTSENVFMPEESYSTP